MKSNIMTKSYKLILMLLIALTVYGCKAVKIIPDIPVIGNLPTKPERLTSEISIPFEVDINSINEYINQKLPSGQIESGSGNSGNTTRFNYQIYRNKPVVFSAQGDELIFKVPIDIQARGSYTACLGFWRNGDCCSTPNPFGSGCATPGVRQTEHGDASPTVDIELRVKLSIREDYTINATTYLKGNISGNTHLHIDLIGNLIRINIDIKDKLEKPLQKFINDYQKEIDKKVEEIVKKYDIKKELTKYWTQVGEPIKLGDFWLKSEPKKIIFENLNAQNNKLRLAVGLVSKLEIVSEKPSVINNPLPNLTLNQNTEGQFNINIPINISFNSLEILANREIAGKLYEKNGIKVKFNSVELKGVRLSNTSLLLIKVNVKGKAKSKRFNGDLYFTALPAIDTINKLVFIEDFRIEPNTNSFLINKGLPYLIDNFYYEELKNKLKYSYQSDYKKYFDLINEQLKNIEIDNLIINGNLEQMNMPGFYIDQESLDLLLIAKGKLKTTIKIE